MPYKDKRVKSLSWFFRFAIPTGISENLGEFVLGIFQGCEQYRLISLPCLHTVSFSVAAERAASFNASSDPNVVSGFVRGSTVIAENAVTEWLPGNEDTSGAKIEWTPIHGRFEKNELIQKFNSDIARNLTTRIDYIEAAPRKQMERPRHGCGSESGSASNASTNRTSNPSMNPVESSLQSSIESSSTSNVDIDAASASDLQSSLGSATSARDLHERRILMAELQAARQAAARAEIAFKELQMDREKAQREREQWERDREKEREESRTELKEVKASLRKLTRKQTASKAVTLRHGDGTTTKLHNVSSVFR